MPTAKKKPGKTTNATSKNGPAAGTNPVAAPDVLTLAEAAAFLRVPEADVVRSAEARDIPARRIGAEWRFSKSAIIEWLGAFPHLPSKEEFWKTHFGALRGDPYLDELLGTNRETLNTPTAKVG